MARTVVKMTDDFSEFQKAEMAWTVSRKSSNKERYFQALRVEIERLQGIIAQRDEMLAKVREACEGVTTQDTHTIYQTTFSGGTFNVIRTSAVIALLDAGGDDD